MGLTVSGGTEFPPPAFIACSARSGSSLLRWLLDTHPDIACPAEADVADLVDRATKTARVLDTSQLDEGSPIGSVSEAMAASRVFVEGLVHDYLAARGKSIWTDKSLSNASNLGLLATTWPQAKFILLYRHCMDMVASGLASQPWGLRDYGFGPFAAMSPNDTVAALIGYWLDRTGRMLAFEAAAPERCIRVKFEGLVESPAATIASVLEFIGAQPRPGLIDEAFSAAHDPYGPSDHKVWHTDGISTLSLGSGSRIPAERVIGPLRESVNALLGQLDYELVGDSWGSCGELPQFSLPAMSSVDLDGSPKGSGTSTWSPLGDRAGKVEEPTNVGGRKFGDMAVVEVRIAGGKEVIWSARAELHSASQIVGDVGSAAGGVGGGQGASTQVQAVIVVERPVAREIRDGFKNLGEALKERSVRIYGIGPRNFNEERAWMAGLASLLSRSPDFDGV